MTTEAPPSHSALVVYLPEVDAHIAHLRREHDPSGRAGIPAHVSVLVPFVPPARLERDVITALGDLFAAVPAFDVAFAKTARFPNAMWLAPEPVAPLVALTRAVHARWPEHPPYEGVYADVIPHCTVAYELEEEAYAPIENEVRAALPVTARVAAVELLRGSNEAGWTHLASFPLAEG